MALYISICRDLWNQIDDLEKETSRRGPEMSSLEAKLFYDILTSIYDKVIAHETEVEKVLTDNKLLEHAQDSYRYTRMKADDLKTKLTEIFSTDESTSSTRTNTNTQSSSTQLVETAKILDSQIRKQTFLIRQIDSLEINDETSAIKAEIIYSHLSQLYDAFISNQIEIEANLKDDGVISNEQQKISKETQQKVIDLQTKLKQISSKTQSLAFQSEELKSSESECDLRATALQLANFIVSSHNTSESQSDETASNTSNVSISLEQHLEISKDIQNKIIRLETLHREKNTLDRLDKIEGLVKESKDRERNILDRLDELKNLVEDCKNQGKDTSDRLVKIQNVVEDLETQGKDTLERLDNLEGVVDECEKQGNDALNRLGNIEDVVEEFEGRLDNVEGLVGECENQGKDAQQRLDNIEGVVDECEKQGKDTLNRLDNVEGLVEECEGRIDGVDVVLFG